MGGVSASLAMLGDIQIAELMQELVLPVRGWLSKQ